MRAAFVEEPRSDRFGEGIDATVARKGSRPHRARAGHDDRTFDDQDGDGPVAEGSIVAPDTVAGRGLTVVVAIMTFLCALLCGGAILIDRAADAWSAEVLDEVSVTVLPLDGDPIERRLNRVAEILGASNGLADVAIVPSADSEALLVPWLGTGLDLSALPVPRLVTARRAGEFDGDAVATALTEVAGASFDDHVAWSERLSRMASAAAGGAIAALALMLVATAISIVFATRSTIATNAATVEVLNVLGAEDRFVAGAFRRRFLGVGARGALAGSLAAFALFGALDLWSALSADAASAQSRALFGDPSIGLLGYMTIAGVAFAAALLVAVTSAISVRHHLRLLAR